MAVKPEIARRFVNDIVNRYDGFKRIDEKAKVDDIFYPEVPLWESEKAQQIFLEMFSSPKFFEGTIERQDKIYSRECPTLSRLLAKSSILELPIKNAEKQPPNKTVAKKDAGSKPKEDTKTENTTSEPKEPPAEIGPESVPKEGAAKEEKATVDPEVPATEEKKKKVSPEVKEKVLKDLTDCRTNLEKFYQEVSEASTRTLERELAEHKESAMEAIAQTFLRKVDYPLEPFQGPVLKGVNWIERRMNKPISSPIYMNCRDHFFSYIFGEVYSRASIEDKEKMIAMLKEFAPLFEKAEFKQQERHYFIQRQLSKITGNPYVKIGITLAIGALSVALIYQVIIPFAIEYFKSSILMTYSTAAQSKFHVMIFQSSNPVSQEIARAASYISTTWIYSTIMNLSPQAHLAILYELSKLGTLFAAIFYVRYPWMMAVEATKKVLAEIPNPFVKVQEKITKSLENLEDRDQADRLLMEGMKAYQVWMYLQRNVREGVLGFREPPRQSIRRNSIAV